jgi:aarF domain-containing kinase
VNSGSRTKTFAKYYSQRPLKIVSTHGRNVVEDIGISSIEIRGDENISIFPTDTSSLDLTFTPSTYNVAKDQITKRMQSEAMDVHKKYADDIFFISSLVVRTFKLGFNFLPASSTLGLAIISPSFRDNVWYKILSSCLAKSGPAFIKWGQWASTRTDMFPDALCVALSQLHADAPAHSWDITESAMEEALCIPTGKLLDIFEVFEREPVASGSIAQVHKAKLRSMKGDGNPGNFVAVKVRHPNVAKLIDMDFRIMTCIAQVVDRIPGLEWLKIKNSVEQFSHTMAAQAHLNVEGHHLEVLNYNFRNWDSVGFPKPLFACSNVIIETFEQGKIATSIIDKYHSMSVAIPVPLAKFIVTTGLGLYLKMLIVDNLMHSDLHPGNIMLDISDENDLIGDRSCKRMKYGHITLVDAGMVAQLDSKESENFIGLMASLGAGDGKSAAAAVLCFSGDTNDCCGEYLTVSQRRAFTNDMVQLFESKCKGYGTNVDVGEVLRGVLRIIKEHHVRIDANYATLVINALCIESLAKRVCPSYNVLDAAKPLLSSYRRLPLANKNSKVSMNDLNAHLVQSQILIHCIQPFFLFMFSLQEH